MTNSTGPLLCILTCIFLCSCLSKKEIEVFGFAYKGEVIIVKNEEDTILNFKIEGPADSNSICSFSRKVNVHSPQDEFRLTIIVDSNCHHVLDSAVILSNKFKKPFISLIYPRDKKRHTRSLFVDDQGRTDFENY